MTRNQVRETAHQYSPMCVDARCAFSRAGYGTIHRPGPRREDSSDPRALMTRDGSRMSVETALVLPDTIFTFLDGQYRYVVGATGTGIQVRSANCQYRWVDDAHRARWPSVSQRSAWPRGGGAAMWQGRRRACAHAQYPLLGAAPGSVSLPLKRRSRRQPVGSAGAPPSGSARDPCTCDELRPLSRSAGASAWALPFGPS